MRYLPLTENDRVEMLREIGASSVEDLFASIPPSIRKKSLEGIPPPKTEQQLKAFFQDLAKKNQGAHASCFLGGGAYEHFIPSVVDFLSMRGEFSTAYTPYQPEVSQGTLQAIFEFQSMIARLLGMDVANASMYEGASAVAEAALMSLRVKKKCNHLFVSEALHPEYKEVLQAYLRDLGVEMVFVPVDETGQTTVAKFGSDVAGMIVQQPNFYGVIENLEKHAQGVHARDGLLITAITDPIAFGILRSPGECGADIVAGEGQGLGVPLSFGGPYVGLFATKHEFLRTMPGRLVGRTVDQEGRPGYCLTLSTREQHIRRDKATSNICTNQSLMALRSAIYMATLGKRGLREVSRQNALLSQELKEKLSSVPGIEFAYSGQTYHEFVLKVPVSSEAFLTGMKRAGIAAGIPLGKWDAKRSNEVLVCVTETKSSLDLDRYVDQAKKVL